MTSKIKGSQLYGAMVIAMEEALKLGRANEVYIDPSTKKILGRLRVNFRQINSPLIAMAANFSFRNNLKLAYKAYEQCGLPHPTRKKKSADSHLKIPLTEQKADKPRSASTPACATEKYEH